MDVALLIVRRVVTSLATLLLVSAIIFAMVELLPGDAASRILGREATPENLQVLRERLHLDRPALARYGIWLGDIVQGNLGTSLISGKPVAEVLEPRIANTLQLSLLPCCSISP